MVVGTSNTTCGSSAAIVRRLLPFNEDRFEDCLAYLSAKHQRSLTVYEMMKLHVMIDVYHTIDHGKPIIGGELWPFTNGPVARCAKNRVAEWEEQYQTFGTHPARFE